MKGKQLTPKVRIVFKRCEQYPATISATRSAGHRLTLWPLATLLLIASGNQASAQDVSSAYAEEEVSFYVVFDEGDGLPRDLPSLLLSPPRLTTYGAEVGSELPGIGFGGPIDPNALLGPTGSYPITFFVVDGSSRTIGSEPSLAETEVVFLRHLPNGPCSGTLVGPQLILTAAHCLYKKNVEQRPTPKSPNETAAAVGYAVFQSIEGAQHYRVINGYWLPRSASDDIAFVHIAETPPTAIRPVPLADGEPSEGAQVRAVGYGCTGLGFGDFGVKNRVSYEWKSVPTSLICLGDSGGPILRQTEEGSRSIVAMMKGYARSLMRSSTGVLRVRTRDVHVTLESIRKHHEYALRFFD
mgnify:CR=1 FL=1